MDIFLNVIPGISLGFELKDTSQTFLVLEEDTAWYNPRGVLHVDLFIVRIVFVW